MISLTTGRTILTQIPQSVSMESSFENTQCCVPILIVVSWTDYIDRLQDPVEILPSLEVLGPLFTR